MYAAGIVIVTSRTGFIVVRFGERRRQENGASAQKIVAATVSILKENGGNGEQRSSMRARIDGRMVQMPAQAMAGDVALKAGCKRFLFFKCRHMCIYFID